MSLPARTIGFAFSEMVTWSFTDGQGGTTPVAVRVSVTDPVAPAEGTKEALSVVELGKKLPPALEVQVPPVAPPVTDPDKEMAWPEQEILFALASTIAAWLTVMVLLSVSVPHSLVALRE